MLLLLLACHNLDITHPCDPVEMDDAAGATMSLQDLLDAVDGVGVTVALASAAGAR